METVTPLIRRLPSPLSFWGLQQTKSKRHYKCLCFIMSHNAFATFYMLIILHVFLNLCDLNFVIFIQQCWKPGIL